jgi:PAS domain S-box-containing protein
MRVEDILEPGVEGVPENIRKALSDGRVQIQERRFLKRNGSIADAEITGTVVEYEGKASFVALVRDVTVRKQIEELSRYKELFENVTDPVFINDAQGRFLEVNDVACERLGYPRADLLRMTLSQTVDADQMPALRVAGAYIQKEKAAQFAMEMRTRLGVSIPFEINSSRIVYRGQPAFLSVARDLSMRKKMEETLVKTERLLAVGEMASGVAHNFNNLLQMIMGGAEAALVKLDAGRIRESRDAIENILNASRRGSGIVKRIKDFTLLKTSDMDEAQVFDIEELVSEALELTKPLWNAISEPRKYRLNFIRGAHGLIKGRPTEIYEVLVNLIKNALEAMPAGGTLTLVGGTREGRVFLDISDTGHGIPPDDFQRIFEPFFTTKGSRSSGLGLSSSYGIVKRHRGEIKVRSSPGEGTTFRLIFPSAKERVVVDAEPAPPSRSSRIRFLLIDDEVNILRSMAMFFEDSEVELITARSAEQGIQAVQNDTFDVVLCDFGMDSMNGLEVARVVKEYCDRVGIPKIPFMLYTGVDKKLEPRMLMECGVDRVVQKPIPFRELLGIVQSVAALPNRSGNRRSSLETGAR